MASRRNTRVPRPARRSKPTSFVKTSTSTPVKPLIYIDLDEIFLSVMPMDEPLMSCTVANEEIRFYTADDLNDLRARIAGEDGRSGDIETLIGDNSKTKGREEATFLRALADLIDAVSKQK